MKKIAIHSVPRSGSTWLGCIFDSNKNVAYRYQPLFSYTHKNQLWENSNKQEIDLFFNDILNTHDKFVLQEEAKIKGIIPHFTKNEITHIAYKEVRYHNILENLLLKDNDIIVIGLIRNPLATINSWLRAPKEFRKELGWNEMEEWRFAPKKNLNKPEEFNGFEKWKEVALLFEKLVNEYPKRFHLITYNELLKNTFNVVRELFNFCDLGYLNQTEQFLQQSQMKDQSEEAYSVYRKKKIDDKWNSELNPQIKSQIMNSLIGTGLEKYLYS